MSTHVAFRWFIFSLFGTIIAVPCSIIAPAYAKVVSEQGTPLTKSDIEKAIAGKRIYLSIPFGGEMPLYYRNDGVVDGSGETIGLGRFFAPTDQGAWWIEQNQLCQKWQRWYEGRQFCFRLESLGESRLIWRRDDGEEGIARVGP